MTTGGLSTATGYSGSTAIPRSIIFVGAGIVGCEYATIFRTMGVRVTLVDGRHRPLEFVDDEIEDALYYHMRDEGIGLRFGETVSSVKMTDDDKVLVTTESGKQLSSEALMFAAGREGCSKSLNLEAVGIETDSRDRIGVNEHYQTSIREHLCRRRRDRFPKLGINVDGAGPVSRPSRLWRRKRGACVSTALWGLHDPRDSYDWVRVKKI